MRRINNNTSGPADTGNKLSIMGKQVNGDAPNELKEVCEELKKCSETLNSIFLQIKNDYAELNNAIDTVITKMKETDSQLKKLRNGTY